MKMVLITYNEAVDKEVMEILDSNSIDGYTKWTKVLGKGKTSDPHLLTHVWPKANNVLAICTDDEKAEKLLEGTKRLRETIGKEGVKAFVLPVEAMT